MAEGLPRRCRWFGHTWRDIFFGEPPPNTVIGQIEYRCQRCGSRRMFGYPGGVIEPHIPESVRHWFEDVGHG